MALVESPNDVPAAWVPDGGLPPTVPPDRWSRPAPHTMAARIAIALLGLALAYLAGRRGAPAWQVLRVAVVLGLTVAVLFGERRAASAWRGLLLAAAGLVGTVAGIGIGLPYAAKAGLTLPCVAGVLALACGLLLLVMGVVGLTRRVHRWRRPLVAVAALVVVVVVVPPLAVAVAATNVPPPRLGAATPASLGLAYSDASFPATDGVRLSGWYIASRTGAAVVLAHGAGSTRSDVLPQAVALARHGYGVLLFDARGHGRSEGTAMDFGWYGDADIGRSDVVCGGATRGEQHEDRRNGNVHGRRQAVGALAGDARIRAVVAEGGHRTGGPRQGLAFHAVRRAGLDSGADRGTADYGRRPDDLREPAGHVAGRRPGRSAPPGAADHCWQGGGRALLRWNRGRSARRLSTPEW